MRLVALELRGLTTFHNAARVDLEAIGSGLVAVIGKNGAGKSSLIEAVPAALYKSLPSRPGLYEHFSGTDAYVSVSFSADTGIKYEVRLLVNAERRALERHIFMDGTPLTGGKSAEADAEVLRLFGSEDLFLSSVFACQTKAGNFLLLPKGSRKALFVELLGIGHLEALALAASDKRRAGDLDLAGAHALVRSLEGELVDLPSIAAELTRVETTAADAECALRASREEVDARQADLEAAKAHAQAYAALARAQAEALREHRAAEQATREAETAIPEARRSAEARRRLLPDAAALAVAAQRKYNDGIARLEARKAEYARTLAGESAAKEAAAESERLAGLIEQIEEAQRADAHAKAEAALAQERLDRVEAENRLMLDGAQASRDEHRRRAALLDEVPCGPKLQAQCPLLEDACKAKVLSEADITVETQDEQPFRSAAYATRNVKAAAFERLMSLPCPTEARARLILAQQAAKPLEACRVAARELGTIGLERERLGESFAEEAAFAQDEEERVARESRAIDDVEAAALAAARDRHSRAKAAEIAAKVRADQASVAVAAASACSVDAETVRLSDAKVKMREAERRHRDVSLQAERLRTTKEALEQKAVALEAHRTKTATQEQEVGDWTILERALGRDGIQALEIDAAGPDVAHICNELLASCYGARFSVAFETLREKKSKRGEYMEALDVRVFDNGQERQVEALSGGEKVVVGEALGLAIAIFNARKSGIRWETLFRDETAGALDQENATAYVDMLRRALALGGFHQVLFVSHQPEVWERADARIHVVEGRIQ